MPGHGARSARADEVAIEEDGRKNLLWAGKVVAKKNNEEKVSPGSRHKAEEAADIEASQVDRRDEKVGGDEESAQHKEDGHTMLPGLKPWPEIIAIYGAGDVLKQNQRDCNTAPAVESGESFHGIELDDYLYNSVSVVRAVSDGP